MIKPIKILATGNLSRTNLKSNNQAPIEDDYISNLQKQVYYLELEMKLMKDREIETKNKIGGYGKYMLLVLNLKKCNF